MMDRMSASREKMKSSNQERIETGQEKMKAGQEETRGKMKATISPVQSAHTQFQEATLLYPGTVAEDMAILTSCLSLDQCTLAERSMERTCPPI
jgi:hypothetical protein